MNYPRDPYERAMKIMFCIIVSYFVIVFIPQVVIKLFQ